MADEVKNRDSIRKEYELATRGIITDCSLLNDLDRYRAWLEEKLLNTRAIQHEGDRPKIICLCGSTRFKDAFDEANYQETMKGNIVLSVGFFMHATGNKHSGGIGATPEQKIALDELHKRKIDLADEIFVVNVGGYIGDSTRSEIEYATKHGKTIKYLEPPK